MVHSQTAAEAIDSFGNRYLLGVFENKADAEKAFDSWNKEYEQVGIRVVVAPLEGRGFESGVSTIIYHLIQDFFLPQHVGDRSPWTTCSLLQCLQRCQLRQAGKDVKENLKNWAKQQEAELAEDAPGAVKMSFVNPGLVKHHSANTTVAPSHQLVNSG